jgi:uncharacterized membrane protein (Fun14 family)
LLPEIKLLHVVLVLAKATEQQTNSLGPHKIRPQNYEGNSNNKRVTMGEEKQDPVERALELAKPVAAQIGFGTVMGYCSGTAMKKIGKMVAFSVGCLFIGLQAAASTGYISVDWAKIKDSATMKMDKVGHASRKISIYVILARSSFEIC